MPPHRAYQCEYVRTWVAIKERWGLRMDAAEAGKIEGGLAHRR